MVQQDRQCWDRPAPVRVSGQKSIRDGGPELVEGIGRGDEYGNCRVVSTSARLLVNADNGSRITDKDCHAHDIDAKLERIGGNDDLHRVAQSFFDTAPLQRDLPSDDRGW